MENPSSNPHLIELLGRHNLTLIDMGTGANFFKLSPSGSGVFARIGDLSEKGELVGATVLYGKGFYVIYDPAKEGEDNALTLEEIV